MAQDSEVLFAQLSKLVSTGREGEERFLRIFSDDFRRITFQTCTIFFVALLGSYGFLLNPASVSGNLLVNNVAMAIFDAIGFILTGFLLYKSCRTTMLKLSFVTTAVLIILSAFIFEYAADNEYMKTLAKIMGNKKIVIHEWIYRLTHPSFNWI